MKSTNYELIWVALAILLIFCLSIAQPLIIKPAMNDLAGKLALQDFETAFQEIQHPAGTARLSLRTAMGDFTDGEQGCDVYVGEVRRYDGRPEAMLATYSHQTVKGNPLQVLWLEGGQIPAQTSHTLPKPLDNLAGWELPSDAEQQALYMVYLMVVDYEGDSKLDCH
jgi:hypothetical protein